MKFIQAQRNRFSKLKPYLTNNRSYRPSLVHLVAWWILATSLQGQLDYHSTPYAFTTLAGISSAGSADGIGTAARFFAPAGIAVDNSGNIYVADTENKTVRKISPTGEVTTLVGKAGFGIEPHTTGLGTGSEARLNEPFALAVDSSGNVIVADNDAVLKVAPSGTMTSYSGDFNVPKGLAIDSAGAVYVADTYHAAIRKIPPGGGLPTPLAGGSVGSADGDGSAAQFYIPEGIAVGPAGDLYVTDTYNHTIRKITPAGSVTTIAGTAGTPGSADGRGRAATFNFPAGIAADHSGNIYVADSLNATIRKITSAGAVTTIAGQAGRAGHVDGDASSALFNFPLAVAVDLTGNLYVADTGNNVIRKITPAGVVSTIAGLSPGQATGTSDGLGSAARFNTPTGVCLTPAGDLYVTDRENHTIRKITATGIVTTYSGTPDHFDYRSGRDPLAKFFRPLNLTTGAGNTLYVADDTAIRLIAAGGNVTTFAEPFFYPSGCAFDSAGNLMVADSENFVVRKVSPSGAVTILAGNDGLNGFTDGAGSAAHFRSLGSLTVDAADNVIVADTGNHAIRKISPAGVVTTLAGNGTPGAVDGALIYARFNNPWGVAIDAGGNIYVTETDIIRRISSSGQVTTLGGYAYARTNIDGVGKEAHFGKLWGIAVDAAGTLYVASGDSQGGVIRKGLPAGAPSILTQPASQTTVPGGSVQFSVVASAVPAPTYQWYFNNKAIAGATASALSFSNTRDSDAGDYTVIATNELGSVTSNKATLIVTAAPAPSGNSGGGAIDSLLVVSLTTFLIISRARVRLRQVK